MKTDNYLTSEEVWDIQKNYCERLLEFDKFRAKIKQLYMKCRMFYPNASENNYRDAWFHYRKMYAQHNTYDVISQIANFEEHLQRAEKDAIIHFEQHVCEILEWWQRFVKSGYQYKTDIDVLQKAIHRYENSSDCLEGWGLSILNEYDENDLVIAEMFCYVMQKKIWTKQHAIQFREIIHRFKNSVLEIRMNGAGIQRFDKIGSYWDFCNDELEELLVLLKECDMAEVFGVYNLLENNIEFDFREQ